MEPGLVVDNSVVMAWCFADETDDYADSVLDSLAETGALVPAVWPLEAANVLVVAERRGRLREADSVRFISLLERLPLTVEPQRADRVLGGVLSLAREQTLSAYNASYLDLAMRNGLPLATRDQKLQEAARRCNLPLWTP